MWNPVMTNTITEEISNNKKWFFHVITNLFQATVKDSKQFVIMTFKELNRIFTKISLIMFTVVTASFLSAFFG